MAQGKLKVKTKVPNNSKTKKQKGKAITKRANCPVQIKKKVQETDKLKQIISKTVNKAVEEEIRQRSKTQKSLSNAQKAVAAHNSKETS